MYTLMKITDRLIALLRCGVRIIHNVEKFLQKKQIQLLAWDKRRELGKRHQAIRQRASP